MTLTSFYRLMLATAIALVGMVATSSRVEASCGDYVIVGGTKAAASAGHAGMMSHAADADALAGHDSKPPRRCRGPHCTSNQSTPSAPAPQFEVRLSEQWLCGKPEPVAHAPTCRGVSSESRAVPATLSGATIYRPPRQSA